MSTGLDYIDAAGRILLQLVVLDSSILCYIGCDLCCQQQDDVSLFHVIFRDLILCFSVHWQDLIFTRAKSNLSLPNKFRWGVQDPPFPILDPLVSGISGCEHTNKKTVQAPWYHFSLSLKKCTFSEYVLLHPQLPCSLRLAIVDMILLLWRMVVAWIRDVWF
jgi:hypothetical protein